MLNNLEQKWADLRYNSMFPWLVTLLVLGVLASGLFIADRFIFKPKSKEQIVQLDPNLKPSLAKNFDVATNLEKVSPTPAIYGYLLQNEKGNLVFLNKELKITSSEGVLQSQDKFLPDSWQLIDDKKVLINQSTSSYIVNLEDGKTENIPNSIQSMVKLANDDYIFIQKRDKSIAIKTSKGLDFGNPKTIDTQEFSKFEPDRLEIRLFNNQPFLLNYTNKPNSAELIRIYSITNKLEKVAEIDNVVYKNFSNRRMLISLKDGEDLIDNKFIDFSEPKIQTNDFNFRLEMGQEGVQGGVTMDRCADNSKGEILCLVKRSSIAGAADFLEADAIVQYNPKNKTSQQLFPNLNISASGIHTMANDELFIFGQENNIIYRIKN
jgi:hypothetical protein